MEDVGDFVAFEQLVTRFFLQFIVWSPRRDRRRLMQVLFYTSCGFMARQETSLSYETMVPTDLEPVTHSDQLLWPLGAATCWDQTVSTSLCCCSEVVLKAAPRGVS